MLTIREALELPVFATSTLVAGQAGLENPIRWVHIVDIPDTHYEWRKQGVLLLTAGYGLKDRPEGQKALIPTLVKKGFAGMVLSTGYYFDHAPEVIRQAADEMGFPVIEAPPELLFIDVTEAVLERIISRQYRLLQQSTEIYTRLTELVLQGADLTGLAETLASLLQRSITIENPYFHVLAAAKVGPVDSARETSVAQGRTSPEVVRLLHDEGIYAQLLEQMGPVYVRPMPHLGMAMERFVAPILVDREIHGYIWIIAGSHPLTERDEMAIRHGATVAALILFKELAVREAEETRRGDFLQQLLSGDRSAAAFLEEARRLQYKAERPHQLLLIRDSIPTGDNTRTLLDFVSAWVQKKQLPALLVRRDQNIILVLESDQVKTGQQIAQTLLQAFNHPRQNLLIGVGQVYRGNGEPHNDIQRSYEEAQEAVQIARALGQEKGVISFAELGLLHWLYHLPPDKRENNRYLGHIQTLAQYDLERGTELVKTLELYLDHGGTLVSTAQALFVHRNTLLHRLERIQELCPVDLHDPIQRLNLHAAAKCHRLQQNALNDEGNS